LVESSWRSRINLRCLQSSGRCEGATNMTGNAFPEERDVLEREQLAGPGDYQA
jgi:hypothetical protein